MYTWDTLQDQDFYLEHDRKAKRRSSMASLHTLMSNLESVVEENNASVTGLSERGIGLGLARRLSHSHHVSNLIGGPMSRKYSYGLFSGGSAVNINTSVHSSASNIGVNSLPLPNENSSVSFGGLAYSTSSHVMGSNQSSVVTSPVGQGLVSQGQFNFPVQPKTRHGKSPAMSAAAVAAAEAVGIAMGNVGPSPSSSNLNNLNGVGIPASPAIHSQPTQQQSKFTPLFYTPNDDSIDIFSKDNDLIQLRCHIKDDFRVTFKDGLHAYIGGDWLLAKTYFDRANKMMRSSAPMLKCDGPTQTILEYMAKYNFSAPNEWKGFRQLTSK